MHVGSRGHQGSRASTIPLGYPKAARAARSKTSVVSVSYSRPPPSTRTKILERLAFSAGLLLLVWLVWRVGPKAIIGALTKLGWGFGLVLVLYGVIAFVNTLAWRATMPNARVGLGSLFAFLLAGDAMNAVTPSAVLGGEIIRISLLRRKMSAVAAATSVVLAAATQFVAQLLFVLGGLPSVLSRAPVGPMKTGFLAAGGIVIAGGAAAVSLSRGRNLFERLHGLVTRHVPARLRPTGAAFDWKELDRSIFGPIRDRPWIMAPSLILYLVGWIIGIAEVALVLSLLGSPVEWRTAAAIETLAVIIDTLLFFIPARLGTQEGGKYVIFQMLGLDPHTGLALGFVRRLRDVVWALVGIAILGYLQKRPD
jgi:glycosyltransferase 2 family protein